MGRCSPYLKDRWTLLDYLHQKTVGVTFEIFEAGVSFTKKVRLMGNDMQQFLDEENARSDPEVFSFVLHDPSNRVLDEFSD